MLHAVGDRAVGMIIEALEAENSPGWLERRLRLEHGDGVFPDLAQRAWRLGVGVVQNPSHLILPELILKRYGVGRAKVDMPLRALARAEADLGKGWLKKT